MYSLVVLLLALGLGIAGIFTRFFTRSFGEPFSVC